MPYLSALKVWNFWASPTGRLHLRAGKRLQITGTALGIVLFHALALVGCGSATDGFQGKPNSGRTRLVGLIYAEVEKLLGPPNEKNELADSNEAYWLYKSNAGTLSVHFENGVVVDIDPADFPVDRILK